MPLPAVGTEPLDYKVYTFHLIALWQVYGRYLQVIHTECALALHTEKVGMMVAVRLSAGVVAQLVSHAAAPIFNHVHHALLLEEGDGAEQAGAVEALQLLFQFYERHGAPRGIQLSPHQHAVGGGSHSVPFKLFVHLCLPLLFHVSVCLFFCDAGLYLCFVSLIHRHIAHALLHPHLVAVGYLLCAPAGNVLGCGVEGQHLVQVLMVQQSLHPFPYQRKVHHHAIGIQLPCLAVEGYQPVVAVQFGALALIIKPQLVTCRYLYRFLYVIHVSVPFSRSRHALGLTAGLFLLYCLLLYDYLAAQFLCQHIAQLLCVSVFGHQLHHGIGVCRH